MKFFPTRVRSSPGFKRKWRTVPSSTDTTTQTLFNPTILRVSRFGVGDSAFVAEESAALPAIVGGEVCGEGVTSFPPVTEGVDVGGKGVAGAEAEAEDPPGEATAGKEPEGGEGGKGVLVIRVFGLCFSCLTASPPKINTATIPAATQYSLVSPPGCVIGLIDVGFPFGSTGSGETVWAQSL